MLPPVSRPERTPSEPIPSEPTPARGRQAEARRNDLAVLEAARDVFAREGFDAPVSAVARTAGVGMGTLYRRYGSKTALLQRLCVLAMRQSAAAAARGLAAEDPWIGLASYVRECVELRAGALAGLAGQIPVTEEMAQVAVHGQRLAADLVGRAQAAGTLRADVTPVDVAWLVEQFSRRSPARDDPAQERVVRARLLAIALDGLRARPGLTMLPGPAPGARAYADRWHRAGGTAGPDPAGPEATGPDPAGPDPAGPDLAGPEPAGPDPAGPEPAGPGRA